jgi:hypothetical protein
MLIILKKNKSQQMDANARPYAYKFNAFVVKLLHQVVMACAKVNYISIFYYSDCCSVIETVFCTVSLIYIYLFIELN